MHKDSWNKLVSRPQKSKKGFHCLLKALQSLSATCYWFAASCGRPLFCQKVHLPSLLGRVIAYVILVYTYKLCSVSFPPSLLGIEIFKFQAIFTGWPKSNCANVWAHSWAMLHDQNLKFGDWVAVTTLSRIQRSRFRKFISWHHALSTWFCLYTPWYRC